MSFNFDSIIKLREQILIGEIGALLHDIGKFHPKFLETNSLEGGTDFKHADIDEFLDKELLFLIKNKKFQLYIKDQDLIVYDLIKNHHKRKPDLFITKILKSCDGLNSADDKGIVRKKQSKENTTISSPFGFFKEKLELNCLKESFENYNNDLKVELNNFIENQRDLSNFRRNLLEISKNYFSHALGETRIPANDVTLWDHSYSTASMFKSQLCALSLDETIEPDDLKWRILGFCWDGTNFIQQGKKISDILKRKEIIQEIKTQLRNKLEDEIPIGNTIYEDIHGIYFTFPSININENSKKFMTELVKFGQEIIHEKSDGEIWPFFTLSKPSRSLRIITEELKLAEKKRSIPKISPVVFYYNDSQRKEFELSNLRESDTFKVNYLSDICPTCKVRIKPQSDEFCKICWDKRKGRLQKWISERIECENTIWMDEIADKNNRISLISLSFNLDKWLDGTNLGTIYSQSFEDWWENEKNKEFFENNQNQNRLKKQRIDLNDFLVNLSKKCLEIITNEDISKDLSLKSDLINTFFQETKSSQKNNDDNYIEKFIENLKLQVGKNQFSAANLQRFLFTQNPSPARLFRIWKETEEFFNLITEEIKKDFNNESWKRIKFKLNLEELSEDIKNSLINNTNTTYIIKIENLHPDKIVVLHTSNGEFLTIESLGKFQYKDITGDVAVENALKDGFSYIALEDDSLKNLNPNQKNNIKITNELEKENYKPIVEILKSPVQLRIIVPANLSMKFAKIIIDQYHRRFARVLGKLPLNLGIIASKRKFPLYILLDSADRLFQGESFEKPEFMDIWWNIDTNINSEISEYYQYYPTGIAKENGKYSLNELKPLSKGKIFSLFPGYFDYDLLLGTCDRFKPHFRSIRRSGEEIPSFSKKPYYLYQIYQFLDLWEVIANNLSLSQINYLEEILYTKAKAWEEVKDPDKWYVFRNFVLSTLKDAFGKNWNCLRTETRNSLLDAAFNGLLLDAITFFRHIIKIKEEI